MDQYILYFHIFTAFTIPLLIDSFVETVHTIVSEFLENE